MEVRSEEITWTTKWDLCSLGYLFLWLMNGDVIKEIHFNWFSIPDHVFLMEKLIRCAISDDI